MFGQTKLQVEFQGEEKKMKRMKVNDINNIVLDGQSWNNNQHTWVGWFQVYMW